MTHLICPLEDLSDFRKENRFEGAGVTMKLVRRLLSVDWMIIAGARCQFWLCGYDDMDRFEIYFAGEIIREKKRDGLRTIPKF